MTEIDIKMPEVKKIPGPPANAPLTDRGGGMVRAWIRWFVDISQNTHDLAVFAARTIEELTTQAVEQARIAAELTAQAEQLQQQAEQLQQVADTLTTQAAQLTQVSADLNAAVQEIATKVDQQTFADHNHALAGLSEKSYNSLTDKPTIPVSILDLTTRNYSDLSGRPIIQTITVVTAVDFTAQLVTTETINYLKG